MNDPLDTIPGLLMKPYEWLIERLKLGLQPLQLAFTLCLAIAIASLTLRVLKLRSASRIPAITAMILAVPPLLTVMMIIIKQPLH